MQVSTSAFSICILLLWRVIIEFICVHSVLPGWHFGITEYIDTELPQTHAIPQSQLACSSHCVLYSIIFRWYWGGMDPIHDLTCFEAG